MRFPKFFSWSLLLVGALCSFDKSLADEARLQVLFLGDSGHHQPQQRARQFIPAMASVGIDVTYTEDLAQLEPENLSRYKGLILYANIDEISPAHEAALLEYVAGGGGFIPLHCATYCFRNSAPIVDLMGAQFQKHGGQVFQTEITQPSHPLMQGFEGFESWDETYVHTRHNERNRIVLEVRRQGGQAEGQSVEPWTWIRTHGKGRVFYTAWGHDQRTWNHPGFLNLVQRGIRWACATDPAVVPDYRDPHSFSIPEMTEPRQDLAAFEFQEVGPKIPNYLAGEQWGTQGATITKMQKPLDPEESLKHYLTPQGFHLELVAAEPSFQGKPIAMNWDHRGRMWICETVDYPNQLQPPGQGRDRIRICEDTDGDGRADKFTVFAEQLSIPTSIEFYRDGVLVQAGTETLYLRDTDGDDRADERQVLISGWKLKDTHGGVSNFQYGLDNRYWAMQGYNDSKPVFAGGSHRGFRMGPFCFTVRGEAAAAMVSDIEFVRSTTNNSWGLGISEEGLVFASTANRAPSFFVPIANRYYERVRGWTPDLMAEAIAADHLFSPVTKNVRQMDHHGGYTAGAGHALYTARNYPSSWWNRTAFVCGPTGHLIGTFVLKPEGASFRDANTFNLLASDDEWAAPIMAEVGPDGNLWILDWYNFIVQHNPTPKGFETGRGNAYETDLRDKTHGRVYRLVYDGQLEAVEPAAAPDLDAAEPQSLLAALSHPNRLWRRHAQRLLVERGQTDVAAELIGLIEDRSVDITGNNAGATHARWTMHGLGLLDDPQGDVQGDAFQAAVKALSHPAAGVRRNAVLVLPNDSYRSVNAIASAGVLDDASAQVQLAALLSLADKPANEAAGRLLAEIAGQENRPYDKHLKDAMICAAASHGESFLVALADSAQDPSDVELPRVVAEHLARSGIEEAFLERLLTSLQSAGSAGRLAMVEGLAAGWPANHNTRLTAAAESALNSMMQQTEPAGLGALLRLGRALGSQELQQHVSKVTAGLFATIGSPSLEPQQRVWAAGEIVSLAGDQPQTVVKLLQVLSPQTPPTVSSGIVRSLAAARANNVGERLVDVWSTATPALREEILLVLVARPETTQALLDALETGIVAAGDLSLDQRQTLASHPDRAIRRRANAVMRSSGSSVSEDRLAVIESYAQAASSAGDAIAGKQLFTKNCAICHKHSGEGKDIGPDLTGMAVHPKEELLMHVLDPSRSVEGNFRRYTLLTADGKVVSGMLAAESLASIELIDADGKTHSISREDIEQLTSSNKSMMPEGFEQQLNVGQMRDLLEYLTQKGKFVPLPLRSVATAISTKGLFGSGDDGPDRMVFSDWSPKQFRGVPFQIIDPQGKTRPNILLLHGPRGTLPPKMPRQVSLPCNMVIKTVHLLSGVSGWGFPTSQEKSTSMIVRVRYEDGEVEEHALLNGVHFADYIRRVDVPKSSHAFALGRQQLRYLSVSPLRREPILAIDLVKGADQSAPMVMAVTAERFE